MDGTRSFRSFIAPLSKVLLKKEGLFMKWEKPTLIGLNISMATGECIAGTNPKVNPNDCTFGGAAKNNCVAGPGVG